MQGGGWLRVVSIGVYCEDEGYCFGDVNQLGWRSAGLGEGGRERASAILIVFDEYV